MDSGVAVQNVVHVGTLQYSSKKCTQCLWVGILSLKSTKGISFFGSIGWLKFGLDWFSDPYLLHEQFFYLIKCEQFRTLAERSSLWVIKVGNFPAWDYDNYNNNFNTTYNNNNANYDNNLKKLIIIIILVITLKRYWSN